MNCRFRSWATKHRITNRVVSLSDSDDSRRSSVDPTEAKNALEHIHRAVRRSQTRSHAADEEADLTGEALLIQPISDAYDRADVAFNASLSDVRGRRKTRRGKTLMPMDVDLEDSDQGADGADEDAAFEDARASNDDVFKRPLPVSRKGNSGSLPAVVPEENEAEPESVPTNPAADAPDEAGERSGARSRTSGAVMAERNASRSGARSRSSGADMAERSASGEVHEPVVNGGGDDDDDDDDNNYIAVDVNDGVAAEASAPKSPQGRTGQRVSQSKEVAGEREDAAVEKDNSSYENWSAEGSGRRRKKKKRDWQVLKSKPKRKAKDRAAEARSAETVESSENSAVGTGVSGAKKKAIDRDVPAAVHTSGSRNATVLKDSGNLAKPSRGKEKTSKGARKNEKTPEPAEEPPTSDEPFESAESESAQVEDMAVASREPDARAAAVELQANVGAGTGPGAKKRPARGARATSPVVKKQRKAAASAKNLNVPAETAQPDDGGKKKPAKGGAKGKTKVPTKPKRGQRQKADADEADGGSPPAEEDGSSSPVAQLASIALPQGGESGTDQNVAGSPHGMLDDFAPPVGTSEPLPDAAGASPAVVAPSVRRVAQSATQSLGKSGTPTVPASSVLTKRVSFSEKTDFRPGPERAMARRSAGRTSSAGEAGPSADTDSCSAAFDALMESSVASMGSGSLSSTRDPSYRPSRMSERTVDGTGSLTVEPTDRSSDEEEANPMGNDLNVTARVKRIMETCPKELIGKEVFLPDLEHPDLRRSRRVRVQAYPLAYRAFEKPKTRILGNGRGLIGEIRPLTPAPSPETRGKKSKMPMAKRRKPRAGTGRLSVERRDESVEHDGKRRVDDDDDDEEPPWPSEPAGEEADDNRVLQLDIGTYAVKGDFRHSKARLRDAADTYCICPSILKRKASGACAYAAGTVHVKPGKKTKNFTPSGKECFMISFAYGKPTVYLFEKAKADVPEPKVIFSSTLAPGDVVLVPPGIQYCVVNEGDKVAIVYFTTFPHDLHDNAT